MKMEDRKLGGSGSAISARAERSGETRARRPRLRPVKHVATPEFLERWRVATNVFERRTKSQRRAVHDAHPRPTSTPFFRC